MYKTVFLFSSNNDYHNLEQKDRCVHLLACNLLHHDQDNLEEMFGIKTPIISVVIGEGGSGGALGIAIADKVLMMEYSIYSVISEESKQ